MRPVCSHTTGILRVHPSALGCEECLKIGSEWVHLRLCRHCGHVGCCDDSPHRHARAHFKATGHPIIEGYDPPEGWGWCFVDKLMLDLGEGTTPQNGPIPRYVRRGCAPALSPARAWIDSASSTVLSAPANDFGSVCARS